jgi:hypothetical protein
MNAGVVVKIQKRMAVCIYCGQGVAYDPDDKEAAGKVYEQAKAHDLVCPKNPLVKRIAEADGHLLDMVAQYTEKTVRKVGTPETYSHDFMSAGEGAFEYLVENGLAKLCENGVDIFDLKWPE